MRFFKALRVWKKKEICIKHTVNHHRKGKLIKTGQLHMLLNVRHKKNIYVKKKIPKMLHILQSN